MCAFPKNPSAKKSETAHFGSVWLHSSEGMMITDGEGKIIAVNNALCELIGKSRENIIGRLFTMIEFGKENAPQLLEKYRDQFAQKIITPTRTAVISSFSKKTIAVKIEQVLIEENNAPFLLTIYRPLSSFQGLVSGDLDISR